MRCIGRALAVAATLLATASAGAQDGAVARTPLTLQPGAKVRVDAPALGVRRFEGVVVATGDTLAVAGGGATVRAPLAAITRVELSRGRSRGMGAVRGVHWGAPIGAVLSVLVLPDVARDYDDRPRCLFDVDCRPMSTSQKVAFVGVGALSGAAWGAAIGAIIGRERWDVVSEQRVTVAPSARGIGVRVAFGGR